MEKIKIEKTYDKILKKYYEIKVKNWEMKRSEARRKEISDKKEHNWNWLYWWCAYARKSNKLTTNTFNSYF